MNKLTKQRLILVGVATSIPPLLKLIYNLKKKHTNTEKFVDELTKSLPLDTQAISSKELMYQPVVINFSDNIFDTSDDNKMYSDLFVEITELMRDVYVPLIGDGLIYGEMRGVDIMHLQMKYPKLHISTESTAKVLSDEANESNGDTNHVL